MKIDEIDVVDFVKFLLGQFSRREVEEIRDFLNLRLESCDHNFLKRGILEVLSEGREAQSQAYKRRKFSRVIDFAQSHKLGKVMTVGDFLNLPKSEILNWKNVGRKSLETILEYLEERQAKAIQKKEME